MVHWQRALQSDESYTYRTERRRDQSLYLKCPCSREMYCCLSLKKMCSVSHFLTDWSIYMPTEIFLTQKKNKVGDQPGTIVFFIHIQYINLFIQILDFSNIFHSNR